MRTPEVLRLDALAAAREGRLPMNEPAFAAFYARMAGPLKGYLRRLIGDAASAEDLLQDAFVRFLAAGRVPEDDAHRRNYLYRIATNLARDEFRRRAARTPRALDLQTAPAADESGHVWTLLADI